MNILLIGGTGTISTEITRQLLAGGHQVTLLNRGHKNAAFPGAKELILDINEGEAAAAEALKDCSFDVVADFICFVPAQAERDVRLFSGKTKQFIFISSASAYQKPLSNPVITESTPLSNPHWEYSRNKILCEEVFMNAYRSSGFPITIVRPSHTFSETSLPVAIHGDKGFYAVVQRMRRGASILMPGDGSTLWAVMPSREFARAFIGLCGNIHALGESVQIAGEEKLTWNQIMTIVARAAGGVYNPCYVPSALLARAKAYDFEGALVGDKSNCVIFDLTKLHRLVPDFVLSERFDQAVGRSMAHINAHPELQVEDPAFDEFSDRVAAMMAGVGDAIADL